MLNIDWDLRYGIEKTYILKFVLTSLKLLFEHVNSQM